MASIMPLVTRKGRRALVFSRVSKRTTREVNKSGLYHVELCPSTLLAVETADQTV